MNWSLQSPEGLRVPLLPGTDMAVGAGADCGLRLNGAGVPDRLGRLSTSGEEAWLHVDGSDPPVAVNGRPVRALSRLLAGDRICFGAFCVDLMGDRDAHAPVDGPQIDHFSLRARGGAGSGRLHPGPAVHLDADGEPVPPVVAMVDVQLVEGHIRLSARAAGVKVNGHGVDASVVLGDGDQLQIGIRRYLVEAENVPLADAVTRRLPVMPSLDDANPSSPEVRANRDALWWLIGIAGLIAALVAGLLYFHR